MNSSVMVVAGISVSQEVTVIEVVSFRVSVEIVLAKPAMAELAVADNKATVENFIASDRVGVC